MSHDNDAEMKLLGALIVYTKECSEAFSKMKPKDFFIQKHQLIFGCLAGMYTMGDDINVETVSLRDELKEFRPYVMELSLCVITSWGWERMVEVIKEHHVRRRCHAFGARLVEKSASMSADELKAGVQAFDSSLNDMEVDRGLEHISEHMGRTKAKHNLIRSGKRSAISTGFKGLDDMILGWEPGKFYVMGARPGDGKSALMLDMVMHSDAKACVFSTEMTAHELCERMIASHGYINSRSLKFANTLESQSEQIDKSMAALSQMHVYVDDSPIKTVEQIIGQVRAQKMRTGVDICFVDYLQYLHSPDDMKNATKLAQVSHVANMSVTAAKILDIPFVMLASLHRYEGQQQRKPRKEDFRDSGQIESNADCAIMLYRDPAMKQNDTEVIELIVDKCRGGTEGTIKLEFDKPHFRFTEVAF